VTATTTMSPTAVTRPWSAAQRLAVTMFMIALFATLAFIGGRASVGAHSSPAIAPAPVAVPAAAPVSLLPCRVGRAC
jgi:hypothetical protein